MTIMRTAARILLAPIWLLIAVLRLACLLAAGIGIYVLTIGGRLLLVYDLLLVILNMSSKELLLQLLAVAGAILAIPFIDGLIEGLLKIIFSILMNKKLSYRVFFILFLMARSTFFVFLRHL